MWVDYKPVCAEMDNSRILVLSSSIRRTETKFQIALQKPKKKEIDRWGLRWSDDEILGDDWYFLFGYEFLNGVYDNFLVGGS